MVLFQLHAALITGVLQYFPKQFITNNFGIYIKVILRRVNVWKPFLAHLFLHNGQLR